MNNRVLCPVMLLVGIAIGAGIGILVSKPKIDESQKELEQLQKQMELSKTESEETIKRAAAKIANNEKELARMKNLLSQMTAQLSRAKAELNTIQDRQQTPASADADAIQSETVVVRTPTGTAGSSTNSVEYVVQENDSLWKIAEQQLGNGIRYQEIIDLNDGLTENTVLKAGMKLMLPKE